MPVKNELDPDALIPARMINEFVYCPRLFYIEWVENEFKDSSDTIEGRIIHRNVDKEKGKLPNTQEYQEGVTSPGQKISSVYMESSKYGISARMDIVEQQGGKFIPVEYKKSRSPKGDLETWPSDTVQVCAQALILKDNGYPVDQGIVYYSGSKKRIAVNITDTLIEWTLRQIDNAKKISISEKIPPPLKNDPKCQRCSLASLCLPDESLQLKEENENNFGSEIRRLYPARQDILPLYVQHQGAVVGKKGEELEIKGDGNLISSVRIIDISSLSLFGNVQITTQTIHELIRHNISITYFTSGGWFSGITTGLSHKNILLRKYQYSAAQNKDKCLSISKKIVEGKIRNSRTLLRRNSKVSNESALSALEKLYRRTRNVTALDELLGIEGEAARIYFGHFKEMLSKASLASGYDFENRNRRPPKDPINAMLSLLYSLLVKDFTVTLLSVGFDPYLGFYHQLRYGKPALALDLMEEFRPLIVDSTVLKLVNNGEITVDNFIQSGIGVVLSESGRKKCIAEYEKRMDELVTHPLFGYTISYRRIIEVQCRLVSRWLEGEIDEYKMFCTR